jgi:6-phosphogluconolactonase
MSEAPTLRVVADAAALAAEAAALVIERARAAVAERGRFMWALSGGATPRATYARLAESPERERMPWESTWVFFGDERCVPPDHPESNYRMAGETLLAKVPVPARQVFRMRGETDDVEAAATEYTRTLAEAFGTRRGELPRFDLILLGFGVDGHTASLFPGSPALKEVFRPVAAVHAAAAAIPQRLTLTYPVLNAAACVVFLGSGAEKAKVVKAMLGERVLLPAAMVQPAAGTLLWLLDRDAAEFLSPRV